MTLISFGRKVHGIMKTKAKAIIA